jgi:hypothetical protein
LTPSGDKIEFITYRWFKIRDFKRAIAEKVRIFFIVYSILCIQTGIDPSQQRLTLNGQELKNDRKIKNYEIEDLSIIHLHLAD